MEKINVTTDGLEFVNDSGRKVVLRTNHGATSDQYIDLPSTGGTISTSSADGNDAVKVSSNDTTAGFLESKLIAGTNITLTTNNDGGNETLTIDAAGGGGGGSSSTIYSVITNDAENTASEVTLYTFTVPANTWADGDIVAFEYVSDNLRSAGMTSTNMTITLTGLSNITVSYFLNTTPTVGVFNFLWFKRVGNDLITLNTANNPSVAQGYNYITSSNRFGVNAGFDFTVDFVATCKVTLPEASASTYIRTRNAYALKIAHGGYQPNMPI